MYSNRFHRLVAYGSTFCAYLGATCIFYDYRLRLFYITKLARLRFYLVTASFPFAWIYVALRTRRVYVSGDTREFSICYAIFLILTLVAGSFLLFAPVVDDLRFFQAETIKFGSSFQRKYIPKFNLKTFFTGIKLEVFICISFLVISVLTPIVVLLTLIVFKDLRLLPHSILPKTLQSKWFILVPEYLAMYIAINTMAAFITLHAYQLATYYGTLVPLLKNFQMNLKPGDYKTLDTLRQMDNLLAEYRTLEYLHKRAMQFYGLSILFLQSLTGHFVLYCNFTLIRHRTNLGAFVSLFLVVVPFIAVCFWGFTLEAAGRFHEVAKKVLRSWKFMQHTSPGRKKLMKKYTRRFRPLVASSGEYFKIRRLSVLKFLRGIVKGTFRALLTL